MDGTAAERGRITVAGHGEQAVDEVGRRLRHGQRTPAQRVWRGLETGCRTEDTDQRAVADPLERRMHRRRPDAIKPAAPIVGARRREGGAGDLLGIKSIGAALGRIAPQRQGARKGLGGKLIAEARLIARPGKSWLEHAHPQKGMSSSMASKPPGAGAGLRAGAELPPREAGAPPPEPPA